MKLCAGPGQSRIENHPTGIVRHQLVNLGSVELGFETHIIEFGIQIAGNLAANMVERTNEETAGAASRVENARVGTRIEHFNHALDYIARSEELSRFLLKRIADYSLVCSSFDIYGCIEKSYTLRVPRLCSDAGIGYADALIAVKHILIQIIGFKLLKERLDSLCYSSLSFGSVHLFLTPTQKRRR